MSHLLRVGCFLLILQLAFLSRGATIDWDNGAVTNVGWHTAANWEGDLLPGSMADDSVILNGAADEPYVVQNVSSVNAIDITLRNDASLMIQADVDSIDTLYLGPNSGNGGGSVEHSSGALSAAQVRVGSSAAATSESLYTLSSTGELITSGNLMIGEGALRLEKSAVSVTVGGDFDLSTGGDLYVQLGIYQPPTISVAGNLWVSSSDSVLTVDGSFYMGGSATFELIRCEGAAASFSAENIIVKGFKANQSGVITFEGSSVILTVTTDVVIDEDSRMWIEMTPLAGATSATESDLKFNNEHHLSTLSSPDLSCVERADGNELVYSILWNGNDFNGDGVADEISFDLRVTAYEDTISDYSTNSMSSSVSSLGTIASATRDEDCWGVGADEDLDAGESLQFQIENVQISVPEYGFELSGFTSFGLTERGGNSHCIIRGEGVGENCYSDDTNSPKGYTFSALDPLVITCFKTANNNGPQINSIDFSLHVYPLDHEGVWDVSDYSYTPDGISYVEPYPAQRAGVDFPDFSWDKVPLWLAVRSIGEYLDEQVQTIATNYSLVMLEKSNQNGQGSTEAGQLKMAADLKAVNSAIKVIAYWNSGLCYEDYAAFDSYDVENWSQLSVDTDGAETYTLQRDYLYKYDRSVEALRDWWVATPTMMAADENIDGIFLDVPSCSNPHFYDEDGVAQTVDTALYDRLKQAMPSNKMLVGNCLRSEYINGHRQSMEVFDGSYLERWDMWDRDSIVDQTEGDVRVNSIQLMREALSLGKMINLQSGPDGPGIDDDPAPEGSTNMEARRAYGEKYVDFPLSIFLIVAETNAYFGYNMGVNGYDVNYNDDVWDASYIDELNRPLGAPLGDPTRDGYIYTRSYEHVDVWVNVETKESVLAWDSVDADGDGLSDRWEYQYFGDITNALPSADTDGDGSENLVEYALGGNPLDASDEGHALEGAVVHAEDRAVFEVTYARRITEGNTLAYWLEASDDLVSNQWADSEAFEEVGTVSLNQDFENVIHWIDLENRTNEYIRLMIENR